MFRERDKGKGKRERKHYYERNIDWLLPGHAPTRDKTLNLSTHRMALQPTGPHLPGQDESLNKMYSDRHTGFTRLKDFPEHRENLDSPRQTRTNPTAIQYLFQ